ncbi:MAG: phospholipase A, partial [Sulfuricaulis sp.]|nr:phospholipase A [Sulfuricaulis sp.]
MIKIGNTRTHIALLVSLVAAIGSAARAESVAALSDCRAIEDEAKRLRCFDSVPGEAPVATPEKPALEQRTQKERDLARRAFAILPHRPSYLLHTYSGAPNVAPFSSIDPQADLQHQELKYQISLRVPLWNKMFGDNGDLWFGYTQMSFWQAFNSKRSSPFRETNYEPEA